VLSKKTTPLPNMVATKASVRLLIILSYQRSDVSYNIRVSVLDGPLVFVDVETTGMSYTRGRVIEVAAIRVENDEVVDSFSSLIGPQAELPQFITELTGITTNQLNGAPTFYDIARQLYDLLDGAVFVAHNVRFDYGFLKHEFSRSAGLKFAPKLLCTVKLSKTLYPAVRGHKLQDLMERCSIDVANRHRAYDDAQATWRFIQHIRINFPAPQLEEAIKRQIKSQSLPKNLDPELIKELPETAGVYIFQDSLGAPLYVGKSVNIKKRVLSHFSSDHEYESEFKISQQVAHIETIETGCELSALLLESNLVKDLQPLFNRQLRRRQKMTIVRQARRLDGFIGISMEDVAEIDPNNLADILGVYSTKGKARQFIEQIMKDFGLCPKLMGFEKGQGGCFSYQLKKCPGACAGKEKAPDYNDRLLTAFEDRRLQDWPYLSPVIIKEENDSDIEQSLVVDKWCVLADIKAEPDCEPVVTFQQKMFDMDTYKILRSFIYSKPHKLSIQPFSQARLHQLSAEVV
jgi:DNA polymerase III subunit epsilon